MSKITIKDPAAFNAGVDGASVDVVGVVGGGSPAAVMTVKDPAAFNAIVAGASVDAVGTVVGTVAPPAPLSITPALGDASGGTVVTIGVTASAGLTGAKLIDPNTMAAYPLTGFAIVDGDTVEGTTAGPLPVDVELNLVVSNLAGDSPPLEGVFMATPNALWSFDFTALPVGANPTLPADPVAGTFTLLRACANTAADPLATVRVGERQVVTGIAANVARIGQDSDDATTRGLVFEAGSTNYAYPANLPASAAGEWSQIPGTGTVVSGLAAPDNTLTASTISVPDQSSYAAFLQGGGLPADSVWSFYYANGNIGGGSTPQIQTLFINLDSQGQQVEPFEVPIFNGVYQWHRFSKYVAGVSGFGLTFDMRTGFTQPVNAPVDAAVWGFQVETGKIVTELIPATTANAGRQDEETRIQNGAACFPGGRCNLNLELCPKGDIADCPLPYTLWSDPNDATTYIEVTTSKRLNVVVAGSAWSPTKILHWKKNVPVRFLVSFGGGTSAAKYRSGNLPLVDLGVSGGSFSAIAPSAYFNALCAGTTKQVTSRIQRVQGMATPDTDWSIAAPLSKQSVLVVADGDSITFGTTITNPGADSWAGQLEGLLGSKFGKIINLGVPGESLGGSPGMISKAATYVDPLFDAWPACILSAWGGTNDLATGSSAATVYASYTTYIQARQAAGWKVVAWTVMDRDTLSGTQAAFDTQRAAFNALVLANAAGADAVVDLTVDALLSANGAKSNATYFSDGTHPTKAACTLIAGYAHTPFASLAP